MPPEPNRGARGEDNILRKAGKPADQAADADEVLLRVRGSKTDQLNEGQPRNHSRVGNGKELCVLASLELMQKHLLQWFGAGGEADQLSSRRQDGSFMYRADVAAMVSAAAATTGAKKEGYAPHSLRLGGATALRAAYGDTGLIQRWGRWASTAYRGHL